MKNKLLLLFLVLPAIIICQNFPLTQPNKEKELSIKGTVVDAVNNTPIEFASVYISGTTIGTTTNRDGRFKLTTDLAYKNILVVSSVGYKAEIQFFDSKKRNNIDIKIKLQPAPIQYSQMDVDAESASKWRDQFEIFKKQFLGTGPYADDCEIQNKYKIDFVEIENKLVAVCNEPIIILNRALGYKITCILSNFEVDWGNNRFYLITYPHFTDIIPSTKDSLRIIQENRLSAYHGSTRHLLFQLANPDLFRSENDFDLSYDDSIGTYVGFYVKEPEHIVFYNKETGNYVINPSDSAKSQYGMRSNAIRITYKGLFKGGQSSLVVLNKDGVRFNKNGFLLSPKDFLLLGEMSRKRISDLLPDDWRPPQ